MENQQKRTFDFLAVGELLIDFISRDFADKLEDVKIFERFQGGSPANLCLNMARLGNSVKLIACVGNDDMGDYLYKCVQNQGVNCEQLRKVAEPTSLILVTRTKSVANFEAYRGADCQIVGEQFPVARFGECRIFHTTCFALSREPALSTILRAARLAVQEGCQLSIDANYAQKIWPDRQQAQKIVAKYCGMGAIVKVSEVDWERLYESPLKEAETAANHFLNLGATVVCATMGEKGCLIASPSEKFRLPARKVEVKDTTGAGDAFWSGFLTAWLDEHSLLNCAKAGRKMAEIKLGHFGSLPRVVEREKIYSDFR